MSIIANQNLADLDDQTLVAGLRDLFRIYRGEAPAPKVWEAMGLDVKATLRSWMLETERRGLYEDRPDGRHYTHVPNARARIEKDSQEIRERLEKRLGEKR
ncbi:MAG: hypothetical protein EXS64_12275 [Candidatus Latescibacteria bacterium]|nr:hypothetical protein [Candidatus Latescibacterota bacterium]